MGSVIRIPASSKLGQLRQVLLVGAVKSGQKVFDALLNFQTQVNEQNFQRGRQYVSTSGNGQSASYSMVGSGASWTQENVFAMSEEYFEILDLALCTEPTLVDNGQAANTRAIFEAMKCDDRFSGNNRRGSDNTLLGFPQVGQLGGPA